MHESNHPEPFLNFCLTPSDGDVEKVLCEPLRTPLCTFVVKLNSLNHKGSQSKTQSSTKGKSKKNPLFQHPFRERLISVVGVSSRDHNDEIIDYHVQTKILLLCPDSHFL
jgi:hypothetical protein